MQILNIKIQKFLENLSRDLLDFAESAKSLTLYNLKDKLFSNSKNDHNLPEKTSKLYISQWEKFGIEELINESKNFTERIPQNIYKKFIFGKTVLDLGGSGRYSLALKILGAKSVTALDYNIES